MKISVIITAHNEGLLIEKTLHSICDALSFLNRNEYEVIIHLDKPDDFLKRHFENNQKYKTIISNFGDPAKSRNYSIQNARGEYIYLIDGDDLVTSNFLRKGIKILEKSKDEIILHPNYNVGFSEWSGLKFVMKLPDSKGKVKDLLFLLSDNPWISSALAKKTTFEKYPYTPNEKGYGFEDYDFNIHTTELGILHKTVPDTLFFYRQKDTGSMLNSMKGQQVTTRYCESFSPLEFKKNPQELFPSAEVTPPRPKRQFINKGKIKSIYKAIRNNKIGNYIILPFAELGKRITGRRIINSASFIETIFSQEAIKQWKKLSRIESGIYPLDDRLRTIPISETILDNTTVSTAYYELSKQVTKLPDRIFIVPWVATGGADKVLLNYLKAFKELCPQKHFAIIATLPNKNVWKDKLPPNTDLIEFGNITKSFDDFWKDWIFSRLIIHLQCKKIHIINSEYGYRWTRTHINLVKGNNYQIDVSLFCHDIIPNTNGEAIFDYADPFATSIAEAIHKIHTDNSAVVDKLEKFGFDKDIISVEYQPIETISSTNESHEFDDKINILWAGRICEQKNPRLLLKIAKLLDPEKFHIDVYGKIEPPYHEELFADLSTLSYKGSFEGFSSLPTEKYDIFLYTSYIDGLPNIILEAASSNLPIISSNSGGISDFIVNNKSGLLINDLDDPQPYIKALESIYSNPELLSKYAREASKLLRLRHSWDEYLETIKEKYE